MLITNIKLVYFEIDCPQMIPQKNKFSLLATKIFISKINIKYLLSKISDYKSDDLREMKCDTQQPGCIQFCHNEFAPISQARFFFFQVSNILDGTFNQFGHGGGQTSSANK